MTTDSPKNGRPAGRAWTVLLAAVGIGLALGVLYAWSVIKAGIPASWGWSNADKALPYSVACLVFALTMVPAGRLQDRFGPRFAATLGGLLAGLGFVVSGLSGSSLAGFLLGFGVLGGAGIGFGYSATTPAVIKWFPPQRTGLVTGIVVAGFGLASVYIAPLGNWLLDELAAPGPDGTLEKGVSRTLMALGAGFLVVVVALAQLLSNPPEARPAAQKVVSGGHDVPWQRMLRSPAFLRLWVLYFFGAAAGLTFISVAQDLGKRSLGAQAFLAVVVLAIGNAGGRVLAGVLSDRFGRHATLFGAFAGQAATVAALHRIGATGAGWAPTLLVVALLGANYGANLALFPSICKDRFGLRGFGMNYGLLFTAWGAAGLVMPWVNGALQDATGSSDLSYAIIVGMLLVGGALVLLDRRLSAAAAAAASAPAA